MWLATGILKLDYGEAHVTVVRAGRRLILAQFPDMHLIERRTLFLRVGACCLRVFGAWWVLQMLLVGDHLSRGGRPLLLET